MKKNITRILSIVCALAIIVTMLPLSALAADNSEYFPRYTGSSGSIVTGLRAVGAESSFNYRSRVAAKNGISGYRGTAQQNVTLLNLLKQGKLLNPDGVPASTCSNDARYFDRYTGGSNSIVTGLRAIGADSSFSYRTKIAAANNISGYRGTASQNTTLLNLLKQGRLINPDAKQTQTESSSATITYYDAAVNTTLRSSPYEASSKVCSVAKGTTVAVSAVVKNSYGNTWYKAVIYSSSGTKEGYIYSGKLQSHAHSRDTFTFNSITYGVCRCGDVTVKASNSAKQKEGQAVVASATMALPLALSAVDGPLPIGDLVGVGILIVGTCFAHDIAVPTTKDLAGMITKADFDEYLKKREDSCGSDSFRKVQRVDGTLKYVDKHCMDMVEAYIYVRFLKGDVYTPNENNALLLAAMHGAAIMERDKDESTYWYHYHLGAEQKGKSKGHIFFGTNDLGETPSW